MIGIFSYTVILTYISLVLAICGVIFGFNGNVVGVVICLLLCGLLDLLDGKVARTKKNRTALEKSFGIEIDSLCDITAFGILPIIIGLSLNMLTYWYIPVYTIYALAGLIRLAYFNSLANAPKGSKGYIGLPITSITLIAPILYLCRRMSIFPYLYPFILLVVAALFVSKIKIPKPNNKMAVVIATIGFIEFLLVLYVK